MTNEELKDMFEDKFNSFEKRFDRLEDTVIETRVELGRKIDIMNESLTEQNKSIALADTAMKSLYGRVERHELEPCPNISNHFKDEHKDMEGKITGKVLNRIAVVVTIIGGIGGLVTVLYWVLTKV
jgi:uncharacterized coiled-coil protein SlyX